MFITQDPMLELAAYNNEVGPRETSFLVLALGK